MTKKNYNNNLALNEIAQAYGYVGERIYDNNLLLCMIRDAVQGGITPTPTPSGGGDSTSSFVTKLSDVKNPKEGQVVTIPSGTNNLTYTKAEGGVILTMQYPLDNVNEGRTARSGELAFGSATDGGFYYWNDFALGKNGWQSNCNDKPYDVIPFGQWEWVNADRYNMGDNGIIHRIAVEKIDELHYKVKFELYGVDMVKDWNAFDGGYNEDVILAEPIDFTYTELDKWNHKKVTLDTNKEYDESNIIAHCIAGENRGSEQVRYGNVVSHTGSIVFRMRGWEDWVDFNNGHNATQKANWHCITSYKNLGNGILQFDFYSPYEDSIVLYNTENFGDAITIVNENITVKDPETKSYIYVDGEWLYYGVFGVYKYIDNFRNTYYNTFQKLYKHGYDAKMLKDGLIANTRNDARGFILTEVNQYPFVEITESQRMFTNAQNVKEIYFNEDGSYNDWNWTYTYALVVNNGESNESMNCTKVYAHFKGQTYPIYGYYMEGHENDRGYVNIHFEGYNETLGAPIAMYGRTDGDDNRLIVDFIGKTEVELTQDEYEMLETKSPYVKYYIVEE